MPRKTPTPLFQLIDHFLENVQPGQIMFCKQYLVRDAWNIGIGAVLNVYDAQPFLLGICKELYRKDKRWFVGDTDALMMYIPHE